MNRVIGFGVLFVVLIALLGGNAAGILRLFVLLVILGTALHVMFWHRLPKRFWGNMGVLLFGPTILLCLLSMILHKTPGWHFSATWLWLLLAIILAAYSWYGWRRWQERRRHPVDRYALLGSEREFVVPYQNQANEGNNLTIDDEP